MLSGIATRNYGPRRKSFGIDMTFDVVIIGSGSAGFSAAQAARAQGAKVCMIEREKLGGECPNWACVPTKALLKAAKVWKLIKRGREFGITTSGMQADFGDVMGYQRKAVETITGGGALGERYERIAQKLGIELMFGSASFTDAHTLAVVGKEGTQTVVGKTVVIATGSTAFIPPIDGIGDVSIMTFKDVYGLSQLPKSMAIIGGGPVGCEFATFFSAIGTRVTLIQSAPVILHREDAAISAAAMQLMEDRGVEVLVSATIKRLWGARGGVCGLEVERNGATETVAVERVLVATGKRPALEGLTVEKAGVALDDRGAVKTDALRRTNVKHVFAAGDAAGGMMLTHTAHHEGYVAGHNAARLARGRREGMAKTDERVVPRVTFVEPEVASVGLTQLEAKKQFKKILVGEFKIAGLGRAVTESARAGLVKLIADAKTRKVVGGHILSESAGEMIHEVALAIKVGAKIDDLASLIHAYPTFSEAITAAANSAKPA